MKIQNKTAKSFALNTITASLIALPNLLWAANVDMSPLPLTGVAQNYAPNVTLALSVEFPTAGAAYSDKKYGTDGARGQSLNITNRGTNPHLQEYFHGYFDNKKCYQFVPGSGTGNGYFAPVSAAQTDSNGHVGLCNGNNTFSGSVMNWMTMSAIDIFRKTMTGGNRAFGLGANPNNYEAGDTPSDTYLRRAFVNLATNGRPGYFIRYRSFNINANTDFALLRQYIPSVYVDTLLRDVTLGGLVGVDGAPRDGGFKMIDNDSGLPTQNQVGQLFYFLDNNLYFFNNGFTTMAVRRVGYSWYNRGRRESYETFAWQDLNSVTKARDTSIPIKYRRYIQALRKVSTSDKQLLQELQQRMPVVVKVCDDKGGIEANCVRYASSKKPEGAMQKHARNGMRVATFGYLLINNTSVDGGVLRSPMKYLSPQGGNNNAEWKGSTGQLIQDPDMAKSKTGSEKAENSGTINYVNKFGDSGEYKGSDPAAELYYTALRYIRNMPNIGRNYEQSRITSSAKDGFPVIYNWQDPLTTGGVSKQEAACRANTIIFIGDTNTWNDDNLPGYNGRGRGPTDNINVLNELRKVWAQEGKIPTNPSDSQLRNIASKSSGMIGLAYWGRTNDIRPDLPGNQYTNNFLIDVMENADAKTYTNPYYLSAKYGGFDNSTSKTITSRAQWTDDPDGKSSNSNFPQGMPRNFALGNNPDNLISALDNAFNAAGRYVDPSQAALGVAAQDNTIIDLEGGKTAVALRSAYDIQNLTGDVIANTMGYENNQVKFTPTWRASTNLNTAYHGTGWNSRNVVTRAKTGFTAFKAANKENFAQTVQTESNGVSQDKLIQYTLGDNSLEGVSLRRRKGLLGTVVNSTVRPILAPTRNPNGCTYDSLETVTKRNTVYAVSANDGMLHLFDDKGNEIFAYMASTALPKLGSYAKTNASHQYLNDGTPVSAELCIDNKAKSVLISTTGRGGAAVYAADVTDLNQLSEKTMMWEFSNQDDADLGLTVGKVTISRDNAGKPIAIFSSGYNNSSDKGYIFVLDISKKPSEPWVINQNYRKIPLGNSGVGEVFVYDENNDGIPDKLYAGDYQGNLWRVTYSNGTWNNGQKLFQAPAGSPPITSAPYAQNINGRLYVMAGTGQLFSTDALKTTQQNYAYGFFDSGTSINGLDNLLKQNIGTKITAANPRENVAAWGMSNNQITAQHQGWYVELPKGQLVSTSPVVMDKRVALFQSIEQSTSENICVSSGTTSFIAVDVKDGSLFDSPIFDLNGDGKFDENDGKIGMISFKGNIALNSSLLMLKTPQRVNLLTAIGTNEVISLNIKPDNGVQFRRLSWREIF